MQLGSSNLTYKCFTTSSGNAFIFKSKGERHESQIPFGWGFLALLWVLASFSCLACWCALATGVRISWLCDRYRKFSHRRTRTAGWGPKSSACWSTRCSCWRCASQSSWKRYSGWRLVKRSLMTPTRCCTSELSA